VVFLVVGWCLRQRHNEYKLGVDQSWKKTQDSERRGLNVTHYLSRLGAPERRDPYWGGVIFGVGRDKTSTEGSF